MGNGSSNSSQQQRQSSSAEEHTYEEIQQQQQERRNGDGFNRFNRNCSIVTLDIKPGEWSRFAEAQKRSKEEEFGGRDVWWGEEEEQNPTRRRRAGFPELEQTDWTARCQEGGWGTSHNGGWKDEAVGSWPTYKRCVSLDVKQIDPKLDDKSDF